MQAQQSQVILYIYILDDKNVSMLMQCSVIWMAVMPRLQLKRCQEHTLLDVICSLDVFNIYFTRKVQC
jgi:hypothetical protein